MRRFRARSSTKHGLAQFPDGDGRHRAGRQSRRHQARRSDLDGPTLAKIFLGEIKTWDDPAIKKLNPSVKLPSQAIAVVHRSDGSGTTFNFAYYLAEVSADWKSKVGVNTSVQWPVGIGAKGNEGVANNVGQHQRLDRLRRVRLRQAEQADLHQDGQQGRQDGCADLGSLPGRRRQCRLEVAARLRRRSSPTSPATNHGR